MKKCPLQLQNSNIFNSLLYKTKKRSKSCHLKCCNLRIFNISFTIFTWKMIWTIPQLSKYMLIIFLSILHRMINNQLSNNQHNVHLKTFCVQSFTSIFYKFLIEIFKCHISGRATSCCWWITSHELRSIITCAFISRTTTQKRHTCQYLPEGLNDFKQMKTCPTKYILHLITGWLHFSTSETLAGKEQQFLSSRWFWLLLFGGIQGVSRIGFNFKEVKFQCFSFVIHRFHTKLF